MFRGIQYISILKILINGSIENCQLLLLDVHRLTFGISQGMSFIFIILLVLAYLIISILILRVQVLQYLLNFVFLGDFELPHMVVLSHVFENASHNHHAVLVITHLKVHFCSLSHFLDEQGTCHCQYKRQAKVRVEFFFFKGCF
jgi:hypothetical protein